MTDQEIIDYVVGEVRAYKAATQQWQEAVVAWQTRKTRIIDEVVQQTGLDRQDAVRRVVPLIGECPKFEP